MKIEFKSATDFRKSLEARLKNLSKTTGLDLQRLRRKVAFYRLLARIFRGNGNSQFILKGGYAMELRFERARATKDIDLTCLERFKSIPESEISKEIFQKLRDVAEVDMKDFFLFQIGGVQLDLENAPYGGGRYPVSSFIDGRLFVRFQLDVGLDVVVNKVDRMKGNDWLDFCDIPSPLLCFSLLFFSQLFLRPSQTAILLFCISFSWGWSFSLLPVQCHEILSIVHIKHSVYQI